jgi:hypothetical protein
MGRTVALWSALALIALLGFLTVFAAVEDGIDVLTIISLLILATLGFGVVGALTQEPPDE